MIRTRSDFYWNLHAPELLGCWFSIIVNPFQTVKCSVSIRNMMIFQPELKYYKLYISAKIQLK